MTIHLRALHEFCHRGTAMAPQLESAFFAQLEDGEDPDSLTPARFATLATRADLLADTGIDWTSEVVQGRLFPPGFLAELAAKLGAGEIDAPKALAELTEREAEVTCRVGGLFLSEVVRRMSEPSHPGG